MKDKMNVLFVITDAQRADHLGCAGNPIVKVCKAPEVSISLAVPSIEKARRILNFDPKISFEEGIKLTIDWYRGILK